MNCPGSTVCTQFWFKWLMSLVQGRPGVRDFCVEKQQQQENTHFNKCQTIQSFLFQGYQHDRGDSVERLLDQTRSSVDVAEVTHLKSPLLLVTLSVGQYGADVSRTTISICWDALPRELVTRHSQMPAMPTSMLERTTSLEEENTGVKLWVAVCRWTCSHEHQTSIKGLYKVLDLDLALGRGLNVVFGLVLCQEWNLRWFGLILD